MDLTEKLCQWGAWHARALAAERAAAQQRDRPGPGQEARLRRLRRQADCLHSKIYREMGGR